MDALLDTSWTLHYTSSNSTSYSNLFDRALTQATHLSRYFDRIPAYLASQKPQYTDDLNDANAKLGTFRDHKSAISTLRSDHSNIDTITFISLTLHYQNATQPISFILVTPYLLLSKAPALQTKQITDFLSETFSISFDPLKLPSSLLSTSLQNYISTLTSDFTNHDRQDELTSENRASALRAALGSVKLTIAFSGPVAPDLRSLDLNVPYETMNTLVASEGSGKLMQELAGHLHRQTGLKLPLGSNDEGGKDGDRGTEGVEPPLKLSKIAAAAFALSVEGKLRFARKAVENAGRYEDLVVRANIGLLEGIIGEAQRSGNLANDND